MAPYGMVIGRGREGDYLAKPNDGGRIVVIKDTGKEKIEFDSGQIVEYYVYCPGKNVDFARIHKANEPYNNIVEDLPSLIQKILSELDTSGISGLLIYDPSEDSSLYFVSIARTEETAKTPLTMFSEWGFKYGDTNPSYCNSSNGLYGICSHVEGDFKQIVRENPKQKGILFLPIAGIAFRNKFNGIEPDIFRRCVESARIEPFTS